MWRRQAELAVTLEDNAVVVQPFNQPVGTGGDRVGGSLVFRHALVGARHMIIISESRPLAMGLYFSPGE